MNDGASPTTPAHPRKGYFLPKEHTPYLGRDVGKGIPYTAHDNVLKRRSLANKGRLFIGLEAKTLVNEARWELKY